MNKKIFLFLGIFSTGIVAAAEGDLYRPYQQPVVVHHSHSSGPSFGDTIAVVALAATIPCFWANNMHRVYSLIRLYMAFEDDRAIQKKLATCPEEQKIAKLEQLVDANDEVMNRLASFGNSFLRDAALVFVMFCSAAKLGMSSAYYECNRVAV